MWFLASALTLEVVPYAGSRIASEVLTIIPLSQGWCSCLGRATDRRLTCATLSHSSTAVTTAAVLGLDQRDDPAKPLKEGVPSVVVRLDGGDHATVAAIAPMTAGWAAGQAVRRTSPVVSKWARTRSGSVSLAGAVTDRMPQPRFNGVTAGPPWKTRWSP